MEYTAHDLKLALADPSNPDHETMLEWLGGPFDPTEFDAEYVRLSMESQFGPKKPRRSRKKAP